MNTLAFSGCFKQLENESENHFFNLLKKAPRTVGVARSAKGSFIPVCIEVQPYRFHGTVSPLKNKSGVNSTVCFNYIAPVKANYVKKPVVKPCALCSADDVYLTLYKWQKKRLIVEI
ncbi:hypothetical protein D1814_09570 [Alteromonas sp. BL110]|nr:hypothetical protein D1814_09570 [Alteromonas sp. BL110]RKM84241.1 hypothetical protein D7031_00870 [Alteromonas sp. BL110]